MINTFDYFGKADDVSLILCNPSGEQLVILGTVYDRKATYRFNALSDLEFTAPYMINGVVTPYYSLIQPKRLVLVDGIMCFLITEVTECGDGIKKYKEVSCKSLEATMNYKKVTSFEGTYKFYDSLGTSASPGLLNKVLEYIPEWTIDEVDTDLSLLYRTFEVDDKTLYSFLTEEVSETYQCVFSFDTLNKTISAHTVPNATTNSDIYLSYDNLIKSTEIKEITDELITCLTVTGGGDLSINSVNPLGTNKIYNFSYYKNSNWMSAGLISSLTAWENKITTNQATYADLLTSLQDYNEDLITLQAELVTLQGEYTALENVKLARIEQGLDLTDINNQLAAKQAQINTKNSQITAKQSQITSVTNSLTAINTSLSFDTNFTLAQRNELSNFMFGSTYTNENFIQTSIMTNTEIQEQAQGLYDQAIDVLDKLSQPRYEFSMDSVNFTALEEYSVFTDQLELGTVVTLDLGGNASIYDTDYIPSSGSSVFVYPALLEIEVNYDDPSDFALTFSNRLRLDNSDFQLSDLLGSNNNSSITTKFNSEQWSTWTKNYQDDVSKFITSSLDAAKNSVISGSAQNILIDQTGIRVRKLTSASTVSAPAVYNPKQLWMNNGIICFTNDNWQTSKLALGEVTVNSIKYYGVVGDALVGRMLIGNNLYMTNQNNSFLFDSSGATLTNATLTLTTSSGNSKIFLDPINGIKIQRNIGGTWTNQLSMDTAGNLIMTGNITAPSGNIGGWNILSDRLQDNLSTPNYIRSDGYIRLGLLTITPTSATFGGTIYANKIDGYLTSDQISSLIASKISGTITSDQIGSLVANKLSGLVPSANIFNSSGILYGLDSGNYLQLGLGAAYLTSKSSLYLNTGGGGTIICDADIYANFTNKVATQSWVNGRGFLDNDYTGSVRIDGTLQVTDRVYSNFTSNGTSSAQNFYVYSNLYAGTSAGLTATYQVTTGASTRAFVFSKGILINSYQV
ncbi:MAG: hypothetical protein PHY08_11535 [Candidatus Cloacimonetes bacterium]|nr:hypothetical protein [Candidatus Cloacimonadota bacterium]